MGWRFHMLTKPYRSRRANGWTNRTHSDSFAGAQEISLGFKKTFFGLKFIPLFNLDALKFQHLPGPSDDNARFLLFESSGGYPIGIFTMYVRSSIA